MMKSSASLLVIGLLAILSCSNVSCRRIGKKDFCQLSSERGRCDALNSKWFYDSASGECKNFNWGGCGGNANRFATKSICELMCKPGCRQERCSRTCPNGFIIDADGCNTCRCQSGSDQSSCPSIDCPTSCPQGYQTDSEGCMTCDCRTEPAQPRVLRTSPQRECPPVCYIGCQYGNRQDENGCPICQCKTKDEACGKEQCMMECPTGFATDSQGCETCECNSVPEKGAERNREAPDCSKTALCTLYCRYGFIKGRDGCDTCRCARRSTYRHHARVERRYGKGNKSEDACGVRPMCAMFCPHGFVKDRKGCDICTCREAPVHVGQLPAGNSSNFPAQLPSNIPAQLPAQLPANIPGQLPAETPAQLPAETPAQLPANTGCSPKPCHKHKKCAFGFAKDEDGCDTCVCSNTKSRSRSGKPTSQRND